MRPCLNDRFNPRRYTARLPSTYRFTGPQWSGNRTAVIASAGATGQDLS